MNNFYCYGCERSLSDVERYYGINCNVSNCPLECEKCGVCTGCSCILDIQMLLPVDHTTAYKPREYIGETSDASETDLAEDYLYNCDGCEECRQTNKMRNVAIVGGICVASFALYKLLKKLNIDVV